MNAQSPVQLLTPVRRPRLVLASRSPRRTSLLAAAGFEHTAEHPGFDDAPLRPGNVTPSEWVSSLAYLKAWAKSQELLSRESASSVATSIAGASYSASCFFQLALARWARSREPSASHCSKLLLSVIGER